MADTQSQKELWEQTRGTVKSDLEIPMDVIASQSKTLTKNWVNGFSEMMFDNVQYNGDMVDLSKPLKPRMLNVAYNAVENGVLKEKNIEMPLLGAVDYPALAFEYVDLKLNYSVGTTDQILDKSSKESGGEVGTNGKVFGVGFSASTRFSLAQSEERTRNTDTRATLSIESRYSRAKNSEAVSRIADILMNSASSDNAGTSSTTADTSNTTADTSAE